MFGLSFRLWRKKKIKYIPNPDYYPLDTYRNFVNFVKDHSHLTDAKLTNRILNITNKKIGAEDVYDLVETTRAALPISENFVERIKK